MARTPTISTYTFTLSDGQLSVQDGTNWQEQDGNYGYLSVASNKFKNAYSAYSECYYKGSFAADQYAQITLTNTGGAAAGECVGVTLRSSGTSYTTRQHYMVTAQPNSSTIRVWKRVGDTAPTQIGADISQSITTGDKLIAEAVDSGANVDIKVYYDTGGGDSLVGTRTDTTSVLSSGNPGVCGQGTSGGIVGDDFIAGTVSSGVSLQQIERGRTLGRGLNRGLIQ